MGDLRLSDKETELLRRISRQRLRERVMATFDTEHAELLDRLGR